MQIVKPLSESQIEQIHKASEDILENVGVRVEHAGLLRRLEAAGARVDKDGATVRIPSSLLRELLKQVPASFTVAHPDGTQDRVAIGTRHWISHCSQPQVIDYNSTKPRPTQLADVKRFNALAQRMTAVKAIYPQSIWVKEDPESHPGLRVFEEFAVNNGKHILMLCSSLDGLEDHLAVARMVSESVGVPVGKLITAGCPILTPLRVTEIHGEFFVRCCEAEFTVCGTLCPMAGATSPYSLAGTLLSANTENLFVAALTQILRPGNPFLYMCGPSSIDMRYAKNLFYSMDRMMWRNAIGQMARHYQMPFINDCGGSMSPRYDIQTGAEGFAAMCAAYWSEPAWAGGLGNFFNAIGFSPEMCLIQMAWLEAAKYLDRGISFDDGRLGLESIKRAGPGGDFLTDELTFQLLRQPEFFRHELFDHTAGITGPSMLENAHEQVEALMTDFESPLPGDLQEKLRRYFHDKANS